MDQDQTVSALRMARVKRGLTLENVAKKVGVSPVSLHYWETGKTVPALDRASDLAKFYRQDIKELFPAFFMETTTK